MDFIAAMAFGNLGPSFMAYFIHRLRAPSLEILHRFIDFMSCHGLRGLHRLCVRDVVMPFIDYLYCRLHCIAPTPFVAFRSLHLSLGPSRVGLILMAWPKGPLGLVRFFQVKELVYLLLLMSWTAVPGG